jgi:CBS domain-containing protein
MSMNIDLLYSRNIIRAPASCTLLRAAALMRDKHIGALLVTADAPDEGNVLGVITDRDLVVRAMAQDVRPGEATIGEFMTRALVMVPNTASVYEAMETMRTSGVRRLGVTDGDGAVVGVVSLDDIIEPLAAELSAFAGVVRTERFREVMRPGARATFAS